MPKRTPKDIRIKTESVAKVINLTFPKDAKGSLSLTLESSANGKTITSQTFTLTLDGGTFKVS